MLDGLADFCTEELAEHGCASVSIAVARGGEIVLEQAHGFADTATGRPATPGTAYALASISKAITATGVCLAVDDGLLGLDDPAPGPGGGPVPTVRQLLQHRSGLRGYHDFHYDPSTPSPIDPDRYAQPLAEPGSGFEYSNLGYRRLGALLERATGRELGDFLRERVLLPLGMTDTFYGAAYPGSAPTAERYTADGRRYPVCTMGTPAAGAAWATAGDLARFGHGAPGLLRPETAAAAGEALAITEHVGYGLGWIISTGPGPQVRSHGGGMGGVAAMVVAVPELDLSLGVLCNSTNKAARDAILDHLLTELVPGYDPRTISPFPPDPARPPALPEGRWAGQIFTSEGQVPIRVAILTEGRITVALGDGPSVTAEASAGSDYELRAALDLQLPTADARVASPELALGLNRRGEGLVGRVAAHKNGDRTGLLGNYLVHACELAPI
ncbi:serine hydrolase domain-containing protein [Kitasatospora viridis]|uniref:CubicO group peptidase (Beta-lactamase class C family) n=1 Tax=Kitasatospora viridis TaxID=281105 RepID=A0A561UPM2_9ACTN|nr:serine hydrolase domain-containing protein [Kitasatospora viridis]TWG01309.1 CubicO group peptidase (beta-lactamase class C family) [Kitasatospora viridis]